MGKGKAKGGLANKHLHARVSFLHQAAKYLTLRPHQGEMEEGPASNVPRYEYESVAAASQANVQSTDQAEPPSAVERLVLMAATAPKVSSEHDASFKPHPAGGLPLYLSTHLLQVARRSQIRLHPDVKRELCKRCNASLIDEETCKKSIQNLSKGGKKPQADVLVLECAACGAIKRFPIGARRQEKKARRSAKPVAQESAGD